MGFFSKAPKVAADGYERKMVQGYADKGPVAKLLAEGWEIETAHPVEWKGMNFKQMRFLLKRQAAA